MMRTLALLLLGAATMLTGCQTPGGGGPSSAQRLQVMEAIRNEAPGDYFVARRYFKNDYKFWGYVRRPGQPWNTARLVIINESRAMAPDRAAGAMGSDNGVEYRLKGHFSGDNVYDPPSNAVYPEFVLTGYEVITRTPVPIFRDSGAALDPNRRVIMLPL